VIESERITGYSWANAQTTCAHEYTFPAVLGIVDAEQLGGEDRRVFDLGCGNAVVVKSDETVPFWN